MSDRGRAPPSLKLPTAALDPEHVSPSMGPSNAASKKVAQVPSPPTPENDAETDNAFEVGKTVSPTGSKSLPARYKSIFSPKRVNSMPSGVPPSHPRPLLNRVFSMSPETNSRGPGDVPLEAYRELDLRQAEFFHFLDGELDKIETFYKQKEDEATARLDVLREQLHIMRDRRLDELVLRQTAKLKAKAKKQGDVAMPLMSADGSGSDEEAHNGEARGDMDGVSWLRPVDAALQAVQAGKYGKSTKAMQDLATPGLLPQQRPEDRRDYVRRPEYPDVSYQTARRKLKVALQEYYRGLELLKSYALLNRTGFRKINKKYDKTVNARPSLRYMTEKVNAAWFVNSDVIEGHIRTTEDLYARYFEKGKHKVAVGKLRIKIARAGDYTENSFRNGLLLGLGSVFCIQGVVKGARLLHSDNVALATDTSYLLQVRVKMVAGDWPDCFRYMPGTSSSTFCLCCFAWTAASGTRTRSIMCLYLNMIPATTSTGGSFAKQVVCPCVINVANRTQLPSFFFCLLGFFVWLNFSQYGDASVFIYYPVILVGITVLVMFNPLPYLYFRSRMWLLYSLVSISTCSGSMLTRSQWRLVLAGLYPVEWRDFYMGDMFCSLTYTMGVSFRLTILYGNI